MSKRRKLHFWMLTVLLLLMPASDTSAQPVVIRVLDDQAPITINGMNNGGFWGFGAQIGAHALWHDVSAVHNRWDPKSDFDSIIKPRLQALRVPYTRVLFDMRPYAVEVEVDPMDPDQRNWRYVWEHDQDGIGGPLNDPEDAAFWGLVEVLTVCQSNLTPANQTAYFLTPLYVPEYIVSGLMFPKPDAEPKNETTKWVEFVAGFIHFMRTTDNITAPEPYASYNPKIPFTCIRGLGAPDGLRYNADRVSYDDKAVETPNAPMNLYGLHNSGDPKRYDLAINAIMAVYDALKAKLEEDEQTIQINGTPIDLLNSNHFYLLGPGNFDDAGEIFEEIYSIQDPPTILLSADEQANVISPMSAYPSPGSQHRDPYREPSLFGLMTIYNYYSANIDSPFVQNLRSLNDDYSYLTQPIFITQMRGEDIKTVQERWQLVPESLIICANFGVAGINYNNLDWFAPQYLYDPKIAGQMEGWSTWYDPRYDYSAVSFFNLNQANKDEANSAIRYEPKIQYCVLSTIIARTRSNSSVYDHTIGDPGNAVSFTSFFIDQNNNTIYPTVEQLPLLVCPLRTGDNLYDTILVLNRSSAPLTLNLSFASLRPIPSDFRKYTIVDNFNRSNFIENPSYLLPPDGVFNYSIPGNAFVVFTNVPVQ